ncbi:hypothetical protein C2S41_00130 [Helicobacter pylori]|nr:hypothetical protein C2S41_00130 [Helicobacter pylori]
MFVKSYQIETLFTMHLNYAINLLNFNKIEQKLRNFAFFGFKKRFFNGEKCFEYFLKFIAQGDWG